MQRGMEAVGYGGEGLVVIADDDDLQWPKEVLARVQDFAIRSGFFVQKMMPKMHAYHLDDAPDLRSCNLMFKAVGETSAEARERRDCGPGAAGQLLWPRR